MCNKLFTLIIYLMIVMGVANAANEVTEADIAKNGAKVGDKVGKKKWTKGNISDVGGNNINDVINKLKLGGGDNNNIVSYALMTLDSPADQKDRTLHTGSDDAIKVWLNGKVVQEVKKNRGAGNFQEQKNVDLKKGKNVFLVAVYECGGGWSMFVGIDANYTTSGGQKFKFSGGVPDKITKGWLWMSVSTAGKCGANATEHDWLSDPGDNVAPVGGPGDKITGPWLWVTTPAQPCGAAATHTDLLDKVTKGRVTEKKVAKSGPNTRVKVGKVRWTPGKISAQGGNNIQEIINKIKLGGGGDDNNITSYAYITVVSPKAKAASMYTGSDDSIKVWLNGEEVHAKAVNRGAGDFQENFKVKLQKGDNPLLVKVGECGGGWSMFVGFSSDVKGLKFHTKPPNLAVDSTNKLVTVWGEIKNPS